VLAALREIYDGRWERNVGTDGGMSLTWTGRIAVVGAVTTAWDAAHAVISVMGDRFVSILRRGTAPNLSTCSKSAPLIWPRAGWHRATPRHDRPNISAPHKISASHHHSRRNV
jgi:hypothetical protein